MAGCCPQHLLWLSPIRLNDGSLQYDQGRWRKRPGRRLSFFRLQLPRLKNFWSYLYNLEHLERERKSEREKNDSAALLSYQLHSNNQKPDIEGNCSLSVLFCSCSSLPSTDSKKECQTFNSKCLTVCKWVSGIFHCWITFDIFDSYNSSNCKYAVACEMTNTLWPFFLFFFYNLSHWPPQTCNVNFGDFRLWSNTKFHNL